MNNIIGTYLDYFLVPRGLHRYRLNTILNSFRESQLTVLDARVDYYNKLSVSESLHNGTTVGDFRFPIFKHKRFSTYFMDLYQTLRYFPSYLAFHYLPGDIIHIPSAPAFVKSRPIKGNNENSVLMKLDKRRHFRFVDDKLPFTQKKDMLVSRTTWAKESAQRTLLNRTFLNHPLCNVGKTRLEEDDDLPESVKPFMTIEDQLEYKFIACIEGNDVASNLKWVMSSNSIAVMPRPIYETWFMEGTLKPDYHYIEVQSDFCDLIDKIEYYSVHTDEAQAIINHAHDYIRQFMDEDNERLIQVLVALKYFTLTNNVSKDE